MLGIRACQHAALVPYQSRLVLYRRSKVGRFGSCHRHGRQQAVPDTSESAPAPKQYLYEPEFGLPVIRKSVKYLDLLKHIRQGKVRSVNWFTPGDGRIGHMVDGPCLVEYIDGTLRTSVVPPEEGRIRYAMETHGVNCQQVPPMPPEEYQYPSPPLPFQFIIEWGLKNLSVLGFLFIVGMAQFRDILRGDFTDRNKIRKNILFDHQINKEKYAADDKLVSIQDMVIAGKTEEEIRKEMKRINITIDKEEFEGIVAEGKRLQLRQKAGSWNVESEEEQKVKERQLELAGLKPSSKNERKRQGLSVKKARMRKTNRSRLKGKLKGVDEDQVFFEDVAGIDKAKRELEEVVDFFNFPERYIKSGAKCPRGVLLYGPPGTGKTLLARAVAGEANATFLGVTASEFVEMYIGVGAARVRELFALARDSAPAVIFIDEVDAVGRKRGGAEGNDERDQTLNQMLSQMDGFDPRTGVVVIAATNRRDILDPALIRPGRFDRQVYVGPPSEAGRVDVLKVHLAKYKWDPDSVDLDMLSRELSGYTGAMIANLCNLAALLAARNGRSAIMGDDFRLAVLQEKLGPSAGQYPEAVTRRLAIVEAATAVTTTLMPTLEDVKHVYTQPTEKSRLGQTTLNDSLARSNTDLFTKRYLQEQLRVALAGRVAERMLLGEDEVSTITMPSVNQARSIVHMLVLGAAMGDNPYIGPQALTHPYLDSESSSDADMFISKSTSLETLTSAQFQMQDMLKEAEEDVKQLVERNRVAVEKTIEALCEPPFDISGARVREIVKTHGNKDDLAKLTEEGVFRY